MDMYKSMYNKDFGLQKMSPITHYHVKPEFSYQNIANGFNTHLQLSNAELPSSEPDKDLEKVKQERPKLVKVYFDIDEIIKENYDHTGRSMYQADYCNLVKDAAFKTDMNRKSASTLSDWNFPETTQMASYRFPSSYSQAINKTKHITIPYYLDPAGHVKKILKIKCGHSEYQKLIGNLGGNIMTDSPLKKVINEHCACPLHHKHSRCLSSCACILHGMD